MSEEQGRNMITEWEKEKEEIMLFHPDEIIGFIPRSGLTEALTAPDLKRSNCSQGRSSFVSDPQTVFLVETGCYSDASIVAVFSTKEAAELYEANCGDEDHRIIEMAMDAETLTRHDWVCVLSLENGDQITCEQQTGEIHYRADAKMDRERTMVSAWGPSEEHARKNAADYRTRKRHKLELEMQMREAREAHIAQQFEDMETSRFIAQRNAETGAEDSLVRFDWGEDRVNVTIDPLPDFPFVAPSQDTRAMMDPFYDMWVAGVK